MSTSYRRRIKYTPRSARELRSAVRPSLPNLSDGTWTRISSGTGLMKKSVSIGILVTASWLLHPGAWAFPQSSNSTNSPDTISKPEASRTREPDESSFYMVKSGDTLYSLAKAHSTTVAGVMALNHLRNNDLQVGQRLRFPAPRAAASIPARAPREEDASPATSTAEIPPAEAQLPKDFSTPYMTAGTVPEDGDGESQTESTEQPLRYRLASAGLDFLGVRYRWNGNSPRTGFDCSGMVKSLFEKFDIILPRSSREQYKIGAKIDKDKLEVGDLVFFSSRGNTPTHVGVYLGDNLFLHAARKARKVLISNLSGAWYTKRFLGARRLSDLWPSESKPAESKSN